MTDGLLTLQQLATESGFSLATLYRRVAPYGDLPVVRTQVGPGAKRRTRGRIRVRRSDWDAWVETHRTAPVDTTAIARAVTTRSISDLPGADRYTR
jgi:predicted DNA-binding transcriptional regulator AlpA